MPQMKALLGTCLLLLLTIGLYSCEKCTSCHLVEYGYTMNDSSVTDSEFCGTSSEVRDYKQELDDAAFHHKKIAGTCCYTLSCVDN